MFIIMTSPPPRRATARLKVPAYDRNKGEDVAHRVVGRQVVVEFLSASFFGMKGIIVVEIDEFEKFFELIKK
jgi:anti-sigma factor RsiW